MIKLGIEADFTEKDIEKIIEDFINRLVRAIKTELTQIGLEMVSEARTKAPSVDYHRDAKELVIASKLSGGGLNLGSADGFNDQTGNLRSSIGYVLMYDGEVLVEDFELSDKGTDKQTGVDTGKKVANEIAGEDNEGWSIVLVAGMEYAYFVEAKGYDVITGSTLSASSKLNKALQNIINAFKE